MCARRSPTRPPQPASASPRLPTRAAVEPIVSRRNTAAVAPYRYMWVGVNGKRTIGQRRGVIDRDDDCVPTDRDPAAEAADKAGLKTCYGWGFHNKPVVNDDHMMITAITALIHLDRGRISRIQWEETCNLARAPPRTTPPHEPRGPR